jgi:hypothetical protein
VGDLVGHMPVRVADHLGAAVPELFGDLGDTDAADQGLCVARCN